MYKIIEHNVRIILIEKKKNYNQCICIIFHTRRTRQTAKNRPTILYYKNKK